MPNQKAIAIAKQLGKPLPAVVTPSKPTKNIASLAKPTISGPKPTMQTVAKPRAAFRPQAFKPSRGK